jgi:hypothetical protein
MEPAASKTEPPPGPWKSIPWVLLALGPGILFLPMIPSWEPAQLVASALACLVAGAWLVGLGVRRHRARSIARRVVSALARTVLVVGLALAALVAKVLGVVSERGAYMGSFPTGPYGTARAPASVYNYELSCYIPDSSTECDYYSSEMRLRVGVLPVTRSLGKFPCAFEEPAAEGDRLVFPVLGCRGIGREEGEALVVDVTTGAISWRARERR